MIVLKRVSNTLIKIDRDLSNYNEVMRLHYKFSYHANYIAKQNNWRTFIIRKNMFGIGLLQHVRDCCNYMGIMLDDSDIYEEPTLQIGKEKIEQLITRLNHNSKIEPRYYQNDAVVEMLSNNRCLAQMATGSGKSFVLYLVCKILLHLQISKRILVIVPNTLLIEQMSKMFEDYGLVYPIHKFHSQTTRNFNFNIERITIGTYQSLAKCTEEELAPIDTVLCDEVHLASCNSIQKIAYNCIGAKLFYGVSGTIRKETDQEIINFLKIVQVFGLPKISVKTKELMDTDYLSPAVVNMVYNVWEKDIKLIKKMTYVEEYKYFESEELTIQKTDKYLKPIIEKAEGNAIILVTHIHQIDVIAKRLSEHFNNIEIHILYGQTKKNDRDEVMKIVRDGGKNVIVGTYACLSTGIDLPEMTDIVFVGGIKAPIKILQSIGRVLRKGTKEISKVWDIVDWIPPELGGKYYENYATKHANERKKIYREEHYKITENKIYRKKED